MYIGIIYQNIIIVSDLSFIHSILISAYIQGAQNPFNVLILYAKLHVVNKL